MFSHLPRTATLPVRSSAPRRFQDARPLGQNSDAHGPGPPQRPHIPGAPLGADDFPPDSAPTAKTLSARAVFVDPHDGHFVPAPSSAVAVIVRCNCSNFAWHDLQVYS